jgi:cellulose synthase/poly-beta-1,6-N-acetylglucosamine synthase-like glycosyltransferase
MSRWVYVYVLAQFVVLAYFAALNLLYSWFGYLGIRSIMVYARGLSQLSLTDALERDLDMPVSILVPAYNEEMTIVASVRSMLALHYPEYEVIVVSDGSSDRTVDVLVEAYALVEQPRVYRRALDTATVLRSFRSLRHPNLIVVEKDRGGRADALNAALNHSQYPLIAAVDADSLLDAEAILRASRLFLEDERVVAVGGTVRPVNGALMAEGRVTQLRMPRTWIERFQVLEYARAFFTGRAGWSHLDALLIISGAFGLFRREPVMHVGGFTKQIVAEDMELVVKLHRHFRGRGIPYRILFTPDPICWTEVPAKMKILRHQRNRWARGLWETLWKHREMLFNRRYGRLGFVAVPYFLFFEALGPVVEVIGYLLIVTSYFLHVLFVEFAVLFTLLSVLYGMLLSQMAVGIETLLLSRYPRTRDRLILMGAALLEFCGYRQILTFERFVAMFQISSKRGKWGSMVREGWQGEGGPVTTPEPAPPPEPLDVDQRELSSAAH